MYKLCKCKGTIEVALFPDPCPVPVGQGSGNKVYAAEYIIIRVVISLQINDVRYNESAARTYTLREEKWSSMSFTLWVRIMATDIQQWL